MKVVFGILSVMCLFMTACISRNNNNHEGDKQPDDFYVFDVGWDYARIPLIKPYEMLKLKGQKEWIMNLHTGTFDTGISDIKEVNVVKGVIILHGTGGAYIKGEEVSEAWFVIIPDKEIETGFAKKEEFLAYLAEQGVDNPQLYDADRVFASFQKKYPINWEKDFN